MFAMISVTQKNGSGKIHGAKLDREKKQTDKQTQNNKI